MFGWLKKNPKEKLEQQYAELLKQAMELQRKGDIVGFSAKSAEADSVLKEIRAAEATETA